MHRHRYLAVCLLCLSVIAAHVFVCLCVCPILYLWLLVPLSFCLNIHQYAWSHLCVGLLDSVCQSIPLAICMPVPSVVLYSYNNVSVYICILICVSKDPLSQEERGLLMRLYVLAFGKKGRSSSLQLSCGSWNADPFVSANLRYWCMHACNRRIGDSRKRGGIE